MSRPERLFSLLFLLLLPVATLGPMLPTLSTHFPGVEAVDYYGTLWFYWFVERVFSTGTSSDATDLFYYPFGKDIYAHTGANLLDAWVALPFRLLLGPVLGFSVFVVVGLLANGLAFYRLSFTYTRETFPRVVSSLLFAASPYLLYEVAEGRPTQGIVPLLPLFLLALEEGRRRWGAAMLGGVLLAAIGYQYWFYGIFSGMVAVGMTLAWARTDGRRAFSGLAVLLLLTALMVAPAAAPLIVRSGEGAVPGLLDLSSWASSLAGGPLSPITVEGHPVALSLFQPFTGESALFYQREGVAWLLGHARPLPWALFAGIFLWMKYPGPVARRPLLVGMSIALVTSFGPILVLADTYVPNPPYLALSAAFSFFRRLWWPSRAVVWVSLLGAVAITGLLSALVGRARLLVATLLVLGLVAELRLDRLQPFPSWDATIPSAYRCLSEGPEGAILELPYGWTQAHLYYQTAHGRPLFGGMLEENPVFIPAAAQALQEENPWIKALLHAGDDQGEGAGDLSEARAAVGALGYRYLVLQKVAYAPGDVEGPAVRARRRKLTANLRNLVGQPVYNDEAVAIYAPWGGESPCGRTTAGAGEASKRIPSAGREEALRELGDRRLRALKEVAWVEGPWGPAL